MNFRPCRGNNQYEVFRVRDGYDYNMKPDEQQELYNPWAKTEDFYEMITNYYKKDDSVKCYKRGEDGCEPEED